MQKLKHCIIEQQKVEGIVRRRVILVSFSRLYHIIFQYQIKYLHEQAKTLCMNYFTALQGLYHEEQITMTTPWTSYKDM